MTFPTEDGLEGDTVVPAALELLARSRARRSLNEFTESVLGLAPARHHRHINAKLEAVLCGDIKRLMLFCPPGSAKSTFASIAFPAYALGHRPDISILASSHTTELAERWGRRVRNLIASSEYRNLFSTRLAPDSQAVGRWATTSGGEYYAAGVGSAILGLRASLGILDDPIAGREHADSEREREKLWDWYRSDFWSRLKPDAAVVLIMQRWREDDLAGRILEDAKAGGEVWEVVSLPMEAEENDALGREVGERLWPEWYKPEMIEQAKRDPRTWLALYQQRPRPDSGGEFKREWIQRYEIKPVTGMNVYILVDPASEKKTTSDYTAMMVVGLGSDDNYYILDMVRDRLNLTERATRLFDLHRKYKPIKVIYEKYGAQADTEHMRDKMEHENYRFKIADIGGTLKKEDRIRRLIPVFESGRMWMPRTLHVTDCLGMLRDLVHDFIEEEYTPFAVGRHDDMIDCLSRIVDPAIDVNWPKTKAMQRTDRPARYVGKQAWMS